MDAPRLRRMGTLRTDGEEGGVGLAGEESQDARMPHLPTRTEVAPGPGLRRRSLTSTGLLSSSASNPGHHAPPARWRLPSTITPPPVGPSKNILTPRSG